MICSVGRIAICVAAAALLLEPASMRIGGALALEQSPGAAPQTSPAATAHSQHMMHMHGDPAAPIAGAPSLPGQDAFGAIQEIVRILEADPATDWSIVDLEGLRQHLIDMNEVTLKAEAVEKPVEGGVEIAITGSGRTLVAIQHMAPDHAQAINGLNGWRTETRPLPNGVLLIVTSSDAKEIAHLRGLGFIGILVSGSHHLHHHLAMAKGGFTHGR